MLNSGGDSTFNQKGRSKMMMIIEAVEEKLKEQRDEIFFLKNKISLMEHKLEKAEKELKGYEEK